MRFHLSSSSHFFSHSVVPQMPSPAALQNMPNLKSVPLTSFVPSLVPFSPQTLSHLRSTLISECYRTLLSQNLPLPCVSPHYLVTLGTNTTSFVQHDHRLVVVIPLSFRHLPLLTDPQVIGRGIEAVRVPSSHIYKYEGSVDVAIIVVFPKQVHNRSTDPQVTTFIE